MKEKFVELKIRKGQKCRLCKKEIKKSWCYNGYWWDTRCKDKDTKKKVRDYLAFKYMKKDYFLQQRKKLGGTGGKRLAQAAQISTYLLA